MTSPQREIILGVGAGIATYKSCDLLRRLQDQGFAVTVVPTPSSLNFVGRATWEALSGRKVTTEVWEDVDEVRHIHLAKIAEAILIAPATADLIARLAAGRADDLLTNVVLASSSKKILVPAMHPEMWLDQATVTNIALLKERGFAVIEPAYGRLTGEDSGVGRFPQTQEIISGFKDALSISNDLVGKRVLISAGGTRESIDPVRFIGNRSSGKQGYALAKAALYRGASVTLVAANSELPDIPGVEMIHVENAKQLAGALEANFLKSDILIMSAAVADITPAGLSAQKLKKGEITSLNFAHTPDILVGLSEKAVANQILIGFAAETENLLVNAESKLNAKKLHILYVNDVSHGAIFGSDSTSGTLLIKGQESIQIDEVSKDTLAQVILDKAVSALS